MLRRAPAPKRMRSMPPLEPPLVGSMAQLLLSDPGARVAVDPAGGVGSRPPRPGVAVGVGVGLAVDQLHKRSPVLTGPPGAVSQDQVAHRFVCVSQEERAGGVLPGMNGQSSSFVHAGDSAAPANKAPFVPLQTCCCVA